MTTTTDTDEHTTTMRRFRVWETDISRMRTPPSHGYVISGAGGLLYYESLACPLDYPVMFSTGLTDAEGQEIYEGDVLEVEGLKTVVVVRYEDNHARFVVEGQGYIRNLQCHKDGTVIGNVYEDPKLAPK